MLAVAQEAAAAEQGRQDQAPSSSCQRGSTSTPHVHPSNNEDIPMTVIQIGTNATQTTRIAGNLGDKLELTLVTFLWDNVDVFAWEPSQMPEILGR
jgi:hypothetical protein